MFLKKVDAIEGVNITDLLEHSDIRGKFLKFTPNTEFKDSNFSVAISHNKNQGTIRGLHFQVAPYSEEKLVCCIQGAIFDVLLDLRPNSSTFACWASFTLDEANRKLIYLPKGIAHGFQTLKPDSIVHYCLTSRYAPEYAVSVNPFEQNAIAWPIAKHFLSERDAAGLSFDDASKKFAASLSVAR